MKSTDSARLDDSLGGDPAARAERVFELFAASYSGPLPPPQILHAYGEIVPTAPERIIGIWEAEVKHRHDLEQQMTAASIANAKRGQWLAFCFAITVVATGAVAIIEGYPLGGFAAVLTALATTVGTFIYQQTQKRRSVVTEPQQRNRQPRKRK